MYILRINLVGLAFLFDQLHRLVLYLQDVHLFQEVQVYQSDLLIQVLQVVQAVQLVQSVRGIQVGPPTLVFQALQFHPVILFLSKYKLSLIYNWILYKIK